MKKQLGLGAIIGALVVALLAPTAASAKTENVSGGVNCTGSMVSYSTVRKMTVPSIRLDLTRAAGSERGGWVTLVGARTIGDNVKHSQVFAGAPNSLYIIQGGYLVGTRFDMYAKMSKSKGACSPTWAGKLGY